MPAYRIRARTRMHAVPLLLWTILLMVTMLLAGCSELATSSPMAETRRSWTSPLTSFVDALRGRRTRHLPLQQASTSPHGSPRDASPSSPDRVVAQTEFVAHPLPASFPRDSHIHRADDGNREEDDLVVVDGEIVEDTDAPLLGDNDMVIVDGDVHVNNADSMPNAARTSQLMPFNNVNNEPTSTLESGHGRQLRDEMEGTRRGGAHSLLGSRKLSISMDAGTASDLRGAAAAVLARRQSMPTIKYTIADAQSHCIVQAPTPHGRPQYVDQPMAIQHTCGHIVLARNADYSSTRGAGLSYLMLAESDPVSMRGYHQARLFVHRARFAVDHMRYEDMRRVVSRSASMPELAEMRGDEENDQDTIDDEHCDEDHGRPSARTSMDSTRSTAEYGTETLAHSASSDESTHEHHSSMFEGHPRRYVKSKAFCLLKHAHGETLADFLGMSTGRRESYERVNFFVSTVNRKTGLLQVASVGCAGVAVVSLRMGEVKMSVHPSRPTEDGELELLARAGFPFGWCSESAMMAAAARTVPARRTARTSSKPMAIRQRRTKAVPYSSSLSDLPLYEEPSTDGNDGEMGGNQLYSSMPDTTAATTAAHPSFLLPSDIPPSDRPENARLGQTTLKHHDMIIVGSQGIWRWLDNDDISRAIHEHNLRHAGDLFDDLDSSGDMFWRVRAVQSALMALVRTRAALGGDVESDFRLMVTYVEEDVAPESPEGSVRSHGRAVHMQAARHWA